MFNTPRAVLDDAGKTALRKYLDLGGNFVAVHAASDALRNTTWFQEEVGELLCPISPSLAGRHILVTQELHSITILR